MTASTPTTLTIEQLQLSQYNVRTNEEDANTVGALAASILEHGLLLPLIVHPLKGAKDRWGVHAGGRRYRAIKLLIERGDRPLDWPIRVEVTDLKPSALIELSLAENLLRKALRPYEEHVAIQRAIGAGATVADVARHFDQPPRWVQQHLRLANLAPPIFEAFKEGQLSIENARAFAATEDHPLQVAAWEKFQREHQTWRSPELIRRLLKVEDQELHKLLLFVGDDAYRAAGGRFELDLFADGPEERGRIVDEDLLRQLVNAKLKAQRDVIRALTGRDLPFRAEPPKNSYGQADSSLEILPAEKAGVLELPAGDVIATQVITPTGEAPIRFWWASRNAQQAASKPDRKKAVAAKPAPTPTAKQTGAALRDGSAIGDSWNYGQQAFAAAKADTGATIEGLQVLRSLRRCAMRTLLMSDAAQGGTVALEYLLFAQLRMLLTSDRSSSLGIKPLLQADSDGREMEEHIHAQPAGRDWEAMLTALRAEPFMTEPDLVVAWRAFRQSGTTKCAAAAIVGLALERSLEAGGFRIPLHDEVMGSAGLAGPAAMRRMIEPTDALLKLFNTMHVADQAQPFVSRAGLAAWTKRKSAEVRAFVLKVLQGTSVEIESDAQRAAALLWVHPMLAFRAPPAAEQTADAEAPMMEAAE